LKSDGKLNRITKDHSFVQTLVDSGVISDEDAETHPKKNQILKALGIAPIIEPTVADSTIHPKKGDVFLLCSDGMSGMVNDASMEMMIDENDLDRSSSTLIQAANDSGGHDNITVTLVGIQDSPHAVSTFKHFNPIPMSAFSSTHIIEEQSNTKQSLFKNNYFYITASLVLFIVCTAGWFLFRGDKVPIEPPKKGEKVTVSELYNYGFEELETIRDQENQIDIENAKDTIENPVCDCIIYVENFKIEKIEKNDPGKDPKTTVPEEGKEKTENTPLDEVKQAEKEGWVKGEPTADEKEEWDTKTVKDKNGQDVKMKKKKKKHEGSGPNEPTVTSGCKTETVSYTIVKGDGYEKIANKFKRCHGLTAESLKQQNDGKELKAGEKIVFECKCEEDIQN